MTTIEATRTPAPARAWRIVRTTIWGVAACIALWAAAQGAWMVAVAAAACIGLALLPRGFTRLTGIAFPAGLTTGILVYGAAALLLGELAGFYVSYPWWDVVLHLIASAVLSVVGMALVLMATGGALPRSEVWVLAVLAFAFSMMVGAMWELMEFTIDALFDTMTQRSGLPDTMGDVAVNLVGGTVGAVAAHAQISRDSRWPLAGLLARFVELNPALYPLR